MVAPGTPGSAVAAGGAQAPGGAIAHGASAALCRLMARLDASEIDGVDVAAMAARVTQAMHAIYGARALGSSAARRGAAAMDSGRWLGECLAILQAVPVPVPPTIAELTQLTARAAQAVHALRQQSEAELGGALAAGAPVVPPWEAARTTLRWSHGVASVHALSRAAIVPPVAAASEEDDEDEDEDDEEEDEDDAASEAPDDSPPVPLDELRKLAASIDTENDSEDDDDTPPLPPPAPSLVAVKPAPLTQHAGVLGDELVAGHLEALAADFDIRMAGIEEDASWDELERLERALLMRADVVAWMGAPAIDPLARALVAAEEPGPAFAAALPLLCMEGVDAADAVLRAAELGRPDAIDGLIEAIRLAPHPEAIARLPVLLEDSAAPATRRLALSVAGERGTVDDAHLDRLLQDPDSALVAAAVSFILRAGKGYALARLEYMADRPAEEPAATQVLVAAAVLGSARARERLRARVRAGDVTDRLTYGLAACGDESDVDALAVLAMNGGPPAGPALVALGWLGSARALPTLRELLPDDGFTEAATEALVAILGPARALDDRFEPGPGRWAQGTPWNVRVPAALLAHPDTGALWRELAFLELCARTGQHVPFDPTWPVARQRAAAASWHATAERLAGKLPAQTWLYRGHPSIPTTPQR